MIPTSRQRVTVKERILLHLLNYVRFVEEYEVPEAVTQPGIANAVGIDARHFPQYARPLVSADLLRERAAHVLGSRQRRKVYFLTDRGQMDSARLRNTVRNWRVEFRAGGQTRTCSVGTAEAELGGRSTLLALLQEWQRSGVVDAEAVTSHLREAPLRQGVPKVDGFVGRKVEMEALRALLARKKVIVIRGIAGIGKTTLGARLVAGEDCNVLWHRVQSWDTGRTLLIEVANLLAGIGRTSLRSYLAGHEAPEFPRIGEILKRDLTGTRVLLVLDDLHRASRELLEMLSALYHEVGGIDGLRLLVLTRHDTGFHRSTDIALDGTVGEYELTGLDERSALELLGETAAAKATSLVRSAGGHPLLLRLMAARLSSAGSLRETLHDVDRFLEDEFYRSLTDLERMMMIQFAQYRIRVEAPALFSRPGLNYSVLRSLEEMGIVRHLDGEYESHDTVVDFFSRIPLAPEEAAAYRSHAAGYLLGRGKALRAERREIEAIACYSNGLALLPHGAERNAALEALGALHARIGGFAEAIECFVEWRKEAGDGEKLRAELRLGEALVNSGRASEGMAYLNRLRDSDGLPESERGWVALARSKAIWFGLSSLGSEAEQGLEECLTEAQRAYALFQSTYEESALGQAAATIGLALLRREQEGDYKTAEEWFQRAVDHCEKAKDDCAKGEVYKNLALLYANLKRPDEALRYATLARDLAESGHDIYLLRKCLFTEGFTRYDAAGDYRGARECFERALGLARRSADLEGVVFFHLHMARIARAQRDWRGAVGFVDAYLDLAPGYGDKPTEMEVRCLKSECAAQIGELALAESELEKGRELRRAFGDPGEPYLELCFERASGYVSWKTGDLDRARTHFRRAAGVAVTIGDEVAEAEAHAQLGRLALERREPAEAREEFLSALDILRRNRRAEAAKEVEEALASAEVPSRLTSPSSPSSL